ncbi:helix-turn-helix domain-containing protein [Chryseobacterium candidae]|uniref:XRE family transcriptional regulator n=1 Tax=Chryseobacterium candidae TaxID=1978493 RepID=A0ABY2R831_9FLAO|nr:helix-turn-helix transcriptional regulator [Chryseobacterium candidae]THV60727.1 XRE family transcriptional regulator [Chryseobacterium candidae]
MIGNNIKNIRELKNLTQEFVAEKLDISQSAYSRLEKGEIKISKEKLVQIAEVLEVKPEDIKEFDGQRYFNSFNNVSDSNIESIVSGMGSEEVQLLKKLYEDKIALMEQLMQQKDKEIEKYKSKYGEL